MINNNEVVIDKRFLGKLYLVIEISNINFLFSNLLFFRESVNNVEISYIENGILDINFVDDDE